MSNICISIKKETHEKLVKIGNKGDSFNDIIDRLIVEHNIHTIKRS